ncbi:hypothetical protein JOM56_012443 [Amanita muscaria]
MTLKLSDFAPELLYCVFCFCSQRDLASLSRVNYTFRNAAEYLLYRDIHISFNLFPVFSPRFQEKRSLFRTLTSNPQAALLRYLHVQLESDGSKDAEFCNSPILQQIVDALRNTHGLEDLRIIVRRPEYTDQPSDPSNGMLSEVIKGGYFQLHTLYCNSYQDLEGIIVSQKRLRLLGIYTSHHHFGYLNISKLIKNSQIDSFPGIFMLTRSRSSYYNVNRLTLFPEFCLPGQTFTLCRDIATYLNRNLGRYPVHHGLTIHVFDFSSAKTAIICELVEAIAQYFVNCEVFTVWVQTSVGKKTISKPWRIPGLSTSISRFKQLQRLNFYVPNDKRAVSDLKSLLYQEFDHAVGLRLVRVCLGGYPMITRLERDSFGWKIENHKGDEVDLDTPLID